ncbi:hypothetical protein AB4622_26145, partial [Vibrio splendidus]|uniref:hypothetical protein n=1 Tax=Vibrio sp. 10N.247.311.26 TaxID=3229995 RepID=UPI00354D9E25
ESISVDATFHRVHWLFITVWFEAHRGFFVKKRPNTPHYIVLTFAVFALLLSISMKYSLFGLLNSIGLTFMYLAPSVSKSALTQS